MAPHALPMISVMASPLEYPMKTVVRIICIAAICVCSASTAPRPNSAATGCTSEPSANATQTLRCRGGLVLVAEEGAKFTLQSQGGSGAANGVDLQDKALLLDAPNNPAKAAWRSLPRKPLPPCAAPDGPSMSGRRKRRCWSCEERSRCEGRQATARSFSVPARASTSSRDRSLDCQALARSARDGTARAAGRWSSRQ